MELSITETQWDEYLGNSSSDQDEIIPLDNSGNNITLLLN
jgi:hypothetical protein